MAQIKVSKAPIEGLYVIEPAVHGDSRGYFMETYNQNDMHEFGLDMVFVQDNQSMSTKGVLRGLHFQKQYPQGKLVRVIRGSVFDVAVDLRSGSSTYGQWYGVELTAETKKQFYISEHSADFVRHGSKVGHAGQHVPFLSVNQKHGIQHWMPCFYLFLITRKQNPRTTSGTG